MKATLFAALLIISSPLAADPVAAVQASAPASSASTAPAAQSLGEVEERLRKVQELINQLELQSEQVKSDMDKTKPQPISFGDGTIAFDFSAYLPNFQSNTGQTAHLGFNLQPAPGVTGYLEIEAIGTVAVNRLLPQWELSMERNNSRFIVKKGEAKFENDFFMARAFRMIPRPSLYEEGDFFYLFPAQDDVTVAFRQTGRGVPNGFQALIKSTWLQGLEVWAGNELVYGSQAMIFGRYKKSIGSFNLSLMALGIDDPNYNSTKRSEGKYEAWLGIPLGEHLKWDLVGALMPTKVGLTYDKVDKVPMGQGSGGSEYLKTTVTTTITDAVGVITRIKGSILPFFDEEEVTANYIEPLAGNSSGVKAMLALRPQRYTLISLEGGMQQPIAGPMPTVFYGTPGNSPGQFSGPRPYYGTLVGVNDGNRERTEFTATIEFNPGLGWFYKYQPRIVQGWNVNYDGLQTPFSSALSFHMWNNPTGTDLGSYISQGGTRTAEALGSTGLLPTVGYVNSWNWITIFTLGPSKWMLDLSNGTSFMGLSPAFNRVNQRPEIRYGTADLTVRAANTTLSGGYAENIWGPDDWYQVFGIAIDTRYRASLTQSFGKSDIKLSYEAWRDKDPSKYHVDPITVQTANGPVKVETPIDQLFITYTIHF